MAGERCAFTEDMEATKFDSASWLNLIILLKFMCVAILCNWAKDLSSEETCSHPAPSAIQMHGGKHKSSSLELVFFLLPSSNTVVEN